ncbi:MAG: glycoside hydrolase [Acidobacteria bacterium]|nr:glycoside hydrolase [Acidobacteriota bacterium]
MKTVMHAMLLLLCLAVSVAAQSSLPAGPGPIVEAERLVASDAQGRPLVEPHLAVDSSKPNHWLVGVIVIPADYSRQDCAAFVSHDGGKTWSRHDFDLYKCADPWVTFLADGTALLTLLAARTQRADGIELLVYRSTDAGRTWSEPVSLGRGHDHQTLALDRSGGAHHGTLYVSSLQDSRERAGYVKSGETVHRLPTGVELKCIRITKDLVGARA